MKKNATSLLSFEEIETIRKYAIQIADSPYLVDLLSSILYDITKRGKNDITDSIISSVKDLKLEEEDEIPIPVVRFLKENVVRRGNSSSGNKRLRMKRISLFIDEIRLNILQKMKDNKKVSCEDLARYSQIFNLRYIKSHMSHVETPNQTRLVIAVGLGEYDYDGILECSQNSIDELYEFFEGSSEQQMKSLMEAYNFIYN